MGHKYTHHDIQNELLHIIATNVLRVKVSTIRQRKFFSMMADEGTVTVILNNCHFVEGLKMTIWTCQKISSDFTNLKIYQKRDHRECNQGHSVKVSLKLRQFPWPDVCRSEQHDGETTGIF